MIKGFYLLIFILSCLVLKSQPGSSYDQVYKQVAINKDSVESIRKMRKFEYMNSIDSLLKQSKRKKELSQKIEYSFFEKLLNSGIFKFISYFLIGIFLAWMTIKFWSAKGVFKRGIQKQKDVNEIEEIEFENSVNYNEKIYSLISGKDYRMAIKYYFIQTLIKLSDADLIIINPAKTNIEYLRELPNQYKPGFSNLVNLYNYVWYGEMNIDENVFLKMQENFITFQNKL